MKPSSSTSASLIKRWCCFDWNTPKEGGGHLHPHPQIWIARVCMWGKVCVLPQVILSWTCQVTPAVNLARGFISSVLLKLRPPPWKWIIHLIALSFGRMAPAEELKSQLSATQLRGGRRCVFVCVSGGGESPVGHIGVWNWCSLRRRTAGYCRGCTTESTVNVSHLCESGRKMLDGWLVSLRTVFVLCSVRIVEKKNKQQVIESSFCRRWA